MIFDTGYSNQKLFKLKITHAVTALTQPQAVVSVFKKAQLSSQSYKPESMNYNCTRTHSISKINVSWLLSSSFHNSNSIYSEIIL